MVAVRCMQELKDRFEADGLSWTIETILQYSFEWKSENMRKTDRECVKRLLGAFVKEENLGDLKRPDMIGMLEAIKRLPEPPKEVLSVAERSE